MRVWHDNSGSGANASWFLKYIVVRDLQSMEKNHFICQKWLAVEHDDGLVSTEEQIRRKSERNDGMLFVVGGSLAASRR